MTTSANQPASAPSTGNAGSAAPRQVNTAFWLYIASAAISLIALIVSLATLGSVSGALATAVTIAVISGILYIAA